MNCRSVFVPRCFLAVVLAIVFLAEWSGVSAKAQTSGAGAIAGTVTDASHAIVPGAAVTVTNVDTGVVHDYTTNTDGLYTAPFLLPGHYTVVASGTNLGSVEAKNLTLLVGQTLTIDLTLAVKSATTTVEVTSAAPLLDTDKLEVSQTLDPELVAEPAGECAQLERLCAADSRT